ncbi:hypothetical protein VDGD_00241 [Verticillium dahliae]|nr:hypothetical protein VdG1_08316 [Verticillium dahliae VDG1]RBQ87976.1 hypothetical protein VDGD_00241 [Verticillium dahliae]
MKGVSLNLQRMARAMGSVSQSWEAIHVAGTNGKGSICTYLSALCQRSNIRNGLFTSPYLVEPRDAIKIDGVPILQRNYARYRQQILDDQALRTAEDGQGDVPTSRVLAPLTEFELVTMTAFTAFDDATIDMGIVEVGLGGRLDSTNALRTKKVTVIAKIGLDHQKMLGETLPEIAKEKAGIMMANVPCVVDGSNPPEVLEVFRQHALGVGAPLYLTTDYRDLLEELYQSEVMPHQAQNMACAIAAFRLAFPEVKLSVAEALPVMANALHRGRLSWLDVSRHFSSRKDKPFLVDGAHNPQSAGTLSAYVEKHVRQNDEPISWVIAVSNQDGKDAQGMFRTLFRPDDKVACVAFRRRSTMPWVEPVEPLSLAKTIQTLGFTVRNFDEGSTPSDTLAEGSSWAVQQNTPVVVTGSLYLVGDAYDLFDDIFAHERRAEDI